MVLQATESLCVFTTADCKDENAPEEAANFTKNKQESSVARKICVSVSVPDWENV